MTKEAFWIVVVVVVVFVVLMIPSTTFCNPVVR